MGPPTAGASLLATGNLKRRDSRAPVEGAVSLEVLTGVPEGAVVDGVNTHVRVVTPAAKVGQLRTGARDDSGFGTESPGWIARQARRISQAGFDAAAGNGVAHRHIALLVHRRAAHPAEFGIWTVRRLLKYAGCRAHISNLVPPRSCAARARLFCGVEHYRVVNDHVFNATNIAIREAEHEPVS